MAENAMHWSWKRENHVWETLRCGQSADRVALSAVRVDPDPNNCYRGPCTAALDAPSRGSFRTSSPATSGIITPGASAQYLSSMKPSQ